MRGSRKKPPAKRTKKPVAKRTAKKPVAKGPNSMFDGFGRYFRNAQHLSGDVRVPKAKAKTKKVKKDGKTKTVIVSYDRPIGQGFSSPTEAKKRKIQADLKAKAKELSKVIYGNPFFSINGIHFSLGRDKFPAFDLESIPVGLSTGQGYIFFGFNKSLFKKTSNAIKVKEYLGLDSKKKASKGRMTHQIELKTQQYNEDTLIQKLRNTKAFAQAGQSERKRLVEQAKAKAKYNYSFKLADLPLFIHQIQMKHPAVAVALAKVYLGQNPGSANNCPLAAEINQIAKLPKNKKPTPAQVKLINGLIGPLANFVSKPTPATPKGKKLRWYQKVGVAFWKATGGRALIGDEMGVGKTIQAIAAAKLATMRGSGLPNPFPILVVCPRSVMENWKTNFPEWMNCNPIIATGTTLKNIKRLMPKQNPIVITTYASANRYEDELLSINFSDGNRR